MRRSYLLVTVFAVFVLSRPAMWWLGLLDLVGRPVVAELEKHT
jgi:hypothetical protein